MSSALYSAVPNSLTGPNYLEWAQAMQSYLMAQGQWNVIIKSPPAAADAKATWDETVAATRRADTRRRSATA